MNEDQGYREIGPDGTITLFKDLLRRLGEPGVNLHIGAPESRDSGEVTCEAVLFTEKHRYTLTAIQPPPDAKGSRLWCTVCDRTLAANPVSAPITAPARNNLGRTGDELTAATFREIVQEIVVNELVTLDTAHERGDFAGEEAAPMAMTRGRALEEVEIKTLIHLMERGGVPGGLIGDVVGCLDGRDPR